ncbi:MAG: ATP-binding protein [Dehalococcoidia bacterium]|nr:ATP-binding protein [Dehalococcoidia bacterium]
MKLQRLTLRNFKGLRDFSIEPGGADQFIFGDNGTGKTTLADAFSWLLFGKDSLNRTDFEVKTLATNGQPMHNLNHEVEAVLDLGDRQVTLRKVYAEKYTKKRGSAQSEFTGHTTEYFVDGVPRKANEYMDAIDGIAGREETFKLLTNPRYFCEVLPWKNGRKIIMDMSGDLTDAEVIASEKALASLPAILGNRKLDDHKKVIAGQKTKINDELKLIPARIDEANRALPQVSEDAEKLTKKLTELRGTRQKAESSLSSISNGGGVAQKTKELRIIEAEIMDIDRKARVENDAVIDVERKKLIPLHDQIASLRLDIRVKEGHIAQNAQSIREHEGLLPNLKVQFYEARDRTFKEGPLPSQPTDCPYCGSPLPAEKIQDALEKHRAAEDERRATFNRQKAEDMERIDAEGKRRAGEVKRLKADNEEIHTSIETIKRKIEALEADAEKIRSRLDALQKSYPLPETHKVKIEEKKSIEKAVAQLKAGSSQETGQIKCELATLDEQIAKVGEQFAQIRARESGRKRIAELKEQEKKLSAEFENLEKELFLCDQFTRTKVALLDSKINSRFKLVRFRLFKIQINGALDECCEVTVNGVPYGGGLNNGMRINAGLDVINALADYYGFEAPIFVDNAESVTELLPTRGQQIRLYVSEADKALRVEKAKTRKEVLA